ncbi:MAG: 3-isopropylmalate dehydratase [Desulfurococcaceae archaeon]
MKIRGRCWKLGDNISTDHIISGKYKFSAIDSLDSMIRYVFEEVIPGFNEKVEKGDIIIAGRNFGKGSSREHAPRLLKAVGISAVVAKSFSHIFFRNAINIGLPVVIAREIPDITQNWDIIEIDLEKGVIRNMTRGFEEKITPYPREIASILEAGGIVEFIKKQGGLKW